MTLDWVKLSLGKDVFAAGQAYVGLSRARKLSGVTLTDFDRESIKVNPKAIAFYENHRQLK